MKFTHSHEWVKIVENGIGVVGITNHAQRELGEIVYIELPRIGRRIRAGQEVAVLESTKAAADIYSPVSGEIIEINQSLSDFSEKINNSPESEGWLFKIKIEDISEIDTLLNPEEYQQSVGCTVS